MIPALATFSIWETGLSGPGYAYSGNKVRAAIEHTDEIPRTLRYMWAEEIGKFYLIFSDQSWKGITIKFNTFIY